MDLSIVESAVKDYVEAPAAYGMRLVEINDGHSLGTNGISSLNYAKFLSARWSELTRTEDALKSL